MQDFRPLAAAATRAALHVLRERGRTPEMLSELTNGSHEQARVINERLQAEYNRERRYLPVCREGCAWCCYASVLVAIPEAIHLANHLRSALPKEDLDKVTARVSEIAARTRDLTTAERFREKIPCPLLDVDKSVCIAHEARPTICRAYNSCDVGQCIKAHDTGDVTTPIPGNKLQQDGMTAVWSGLLSASVIERLEGGALELSAALHVALTEPQVEAAWLRGERPFEHAKTKMSRTAEASYHKLVAGAVSELSSASPAPPIADANERARKERNRKKRKRKR